ncbi:MAG: response regulator [Amylibacter sp.]|nr:response regulator [Amylibacter sp.]
MDDSLEIDWIRPKCSINRPLLGITILLVEDSRYCSEAMRLLSIRSGARLRRADSLQAARRHLRIYRPDVVLVDLGLPDGSGLELIEEIAKTPVPISAIIATSGSANGDEALKAGAAYFMAKPIVDLAGFQQTLLAALPDEMKPSGFVPRLAGSCVRPDAQAMKDDLEHIDVVLKDCLRDKDCDTFAYIIQFLDSLGRDANSKRIMHATTILRDLAKEDRFSGDAVQQEFINIHKAVDGRLSQSAQVN